MAHALPKRADIPKAHTWDLEALFRTQKEWEKAIAAVDAVLPELRACAGTLGNSAQSLFAFMKRYEEIAPRAQHIYTWAMLHSDSDTTDQKKLASAGRGAGLYARFGEAISFLQPEILALDEAVLQRFLEDEPALRTYAHFFENIQRMRPHVRSAEVEQVLALGREALSAPERAHGGLADADLTFSPAENEKGRALPLGRGNYGSMQSSPDRVLRQNSWNNYADGFLSMRNTFAEIMSAKVKSTVFQSRVRRYPDSLTAALTPNAISTAVYQNVIDACNRNLSIWHRFWEAKRRLLKLRKMEGCDVFAPLSRPVKTSWEQAIEHLVAGLQPLGAPYADAVRKGVTKERWVDWRPNIGKRGGAYSAGGYGTRPYILMSYHEEGLQGLSTLAPDVGHSMHTLLSCRTQPYAYADYTLFVAEVASNFNQALVRAHLLNTDRARRDRNFQINVIEEAMYNFHRYLFVMPILSQFEHWMHTQVEQGGALTADEMTQHLAGLFKRGYGPAWKIDAPREGIAWAQYPHFYADFYVYQYASGIAAANALAADVLADASGSAAGRYLDFLRSGA
ncbi:MAG: oligoendopeptidase F family protein [Chloroflexi bacterium]|nr:oligoendopeptidase F family protein [Chloroflexota bacterium]